MRARSTQSAALAKYPNVSVKLSAIAAVFRGGLSVPRHDPPYPAPFDAYGPHRCYWGTDITNSFAKATYRQRMTQFTEEMSFLSEERQGLDHGQVDPAEAQLGLSGLGATGAQMWATILRPRALPATDRLACPACLGRRFKPAGTIASMRLARRHVRLLY